MKLERFFEKFGLFADAPNAVGKMRELVLLLAMQGKLSEVKDRDVPVSVLLRDIEDEKARLGITSTAMRSREDSENIEDEMSDAIPERWTWVRFGDIARHNAGKTLDKGRNSGELRDYITTSNLYWGFFRLEDVRQMPIQDDELDRCTAKKGDLLICEGGEAGRAAVWSHGYDISFQNHVHRARFYGGINPYFVQRFFEKLKATGEIDKFRKGVGISNMSGKALASVVLPLPPLAEQNRIVAKVDELMVLCDRLEAQQQERDTRHATLARASLIRFAEAPTPANLDFLFHKSYPITPADLRKAILSLAVQGKLVDQDTNDEPVKDFLQRISEIRNTSNAKAFLPVSADECPYDIPESWMWTRLGSISLKSDSGWSPQCHSEHRTGNDWGVLKVSAVSWGVFQPEENKALPTGMAGRPECEVHAGDFLISRANTAELVARSVIVIQTPPHLMMSDKIVRFIFPDEVEKSFINLTNSSDFARDYYARNASGTSSSMKNIGREVMCNLPIPLPPVDEQRRIVAKVDQLMALVDRLETQLATSRTAAAKLMEAVVAELTGQPLEIAA